MVPKPKHLGRQYADQFQDASVVAAYRHRPTYPPATFDILAGLITESPRTVLDIGCGTGFIARHLVDHVDRLDAVDVSAAMIEEGKRLPNGDHPRLNWILAPVEEAPLRPPYALISAGQSLHWMAWERVFPRFRETLTPAGLLAIVGMDVAPMPWWEGELLPVIRRYSTNRDFRPTDLVAELEARRLFVVQGEAYTKPVSFVQPVGDYVESFHARNGFSRERMTPESAAAFDREAYDVVAAHCPDGQVRLENRGHVVWGHTNPQSPC